MSQERLSEEPLETEEPKPQDEKRGLKKRLKKLHDHKSDKKRISLRKCSHKKSARPITGQTIHHEDYELLGKEKKRRHSKQQSTSMIKELAPFSSTFTFLAGQKCSKADISGTRFNGLTTSCMQSLHQRNTILKEVKNLSSALLQKQDLLDQAVKRFKEERKKHKRAAKQKNMIEMKKRD